MLPALLLLAANTLSFGKNVPCQKAPLIEVGYDAFGLLTPQGKYLYFRVCEDGLLTYEVEGVPMGTKVLRSGHLSASQLAALRQLMEQEDVRTLRGAL